MAGVLAVIVITAALVLGHATPAGAADGHAEAQFVARINGIRQSHGLAPLAVYGELTGIARNWTDQMVANGGLSHNGSLSREVSANWTKLGENVGMGPDFDTVMNAFINSGAHYKNITDPAFNYIGVGVSYDANGQMVTTHDFMALDDGSAPAAPPPAPRPRAAPAPAPEPDPAPEPAPEPAPVTAAAAPERMQTMLAALRVVDTPTNAAPSTLDRAASHA